MKTNYKHLIAAIDAAAQKDPRGWKSDGVFVAVDNFTKYKCQQLSKLTGYKVVIADHSGISVYRSQKNYLAWLKWRREEMPHITCMNWPNCDTEGCGHRD